MIGNPMRGCEAASKAKPPKRLKQATNTYTAGAGASAPNHPSSATSNAPRSMPPPARIARFPE
jgi:hypothetical protein